MQFFAVLLHTLGILYSQCGYPNFFSCLLFIYMCSQILLFAQFYHKTYVMKRSSVRTLSNGSTNNINGLYSKIPDMENCTNGHTKINGVQNGFSTAHQNRVQNSLIYNTQDCYGDISNGALKNGHHQKHE